MRSKLLRPRSRWLSGLTLLGVLLTAGAALAATQGTTNTGDNSASDGETWTFSGTCIYRSWDTSGGTEEYEFSPYNPVATFLPEQDVHYVNATVYYRAAVIYDGSTIVWQSAPQDMMDSMTIAGNQTDKQS